MTSTTDLIARLRDGIVVQQAGPSALIGTPDFTATVALMREAADRLDSLSTVERDLDEARAQLTRVTSPEYLAGALSRVGVADQAEVARLTEALRPFEEFAANNTDDNGWAGSQCQRERICDWFGPSDFRAALQQKEAGE